MMNTSNQTYKELAIPYFKEVFEIVDNIMNEFQIPYYLIGASAIALELLKSGIKPSRGTKDIDFAIMLSSMQEFEKLSNTLTQNGFNKVKAPWTFYSQKYSIAIDLMPFGEIEEKDTLNFNQRNVDLHVLGFKEVLKNANYVQIEDKIVNIPALPGMIILKLVAWSDRPEERTDDLSDIAKIIQHYFDHNFDEIVEHHHDTFPKDKLDPIKVSAEVLGREASAYLEKSKNLSERIFSIIEENFNQKVHSIIAKSWAISQNWEIQYALEVLQAFQKGLKR